MAQQPISPKQRRAALAALGRGATNAEAAAEAGIALATLKRLKAGPKPRAAHAPVDPSQPPASSAPAELPTTLVEALEVELIDSIGERRKAEGAERVRWGAHVSKLIGQLDRIRPDAAPTREELEARLRPKAEDVLGKIKNGITAVATREAETGACLRCGHELPPELILRRRIEAGMSDPLPTH